MSISLAPAPNGMICVWISTTASTVVNTLLFVAIGVNVKMFLAFLLSGFFMSRPWWVRALLVVYLLPWALPALTVFLSFHWMLVRSGAWSSSLGGASGSRRRCS